MARIYTKDSRLLNERKSLEAWLKSHMGEYIVARAKKHSQMQSCDYRKRTDFSMFDVKMREKGKEYDREWLYEACNALGDIAPLYMLESMSLYSDDVIEILERIEPETLELIRAISEMDGR